MNASTCPKCGSSHLVLEKSIDGLTMCQDCGHSNRHKDWYIEHLRKENNELKAKVSELEMRLKSKGKNK